MMSALERIKKADAARQRIADFEINGDNIPLAVKVYPIKDFQKLVDRFSTTPNEKTAQFLADQFTDPETGKPAFTGADLLDCSMSVWKGLIMFLGAVNRGEFEQKKS
ncbi:hypothetical protein [Victivallis vadensis]|uniref:hypothetical protein n=1 Tax=Victivallis vadensis TaxID=172901 RepID=UPI003AF474A2